MLTKEQKRYIREFAEDLVDVWRINLGEEGFAEEIEIDVGSDAYREMKEMLYTEIYAAFKVGQD